ncbi:MAG TPA: hypothetical protein VGO40_02705 [Longimicrobium sp.]|jgi:hypothetical protein|nr:hypothetical protein [Longimicrobium sp.]
MRRAAVAAAVAAISLAGCKVKVKDSGELPRVDVQPGKMPDVEVTTDSLRMPDVKVPEIKAPDIKLPDVKVPEVKAPDIKLPDLDGSDRGRARTDTTRRP